MTRRCRTNKRGTTKCWTMEANWNSKSRILWTTRATSRVVSPHQRVSPTSSRSSSDGADLGETMRTRGSSTKREERWMNGVEGLKLFCSNCSLMARGPGQFNRSQTLKFLQTNPSTFTPPMKPSLSRYQSKTPPRQISPRQLMLNSIRTD